MKVTRTIAAALLLSATLAACSGSDDAASDDSAAVSAAAAAQALPATPSNDTAVIHIPLTEWSVVVSQGIVSPGTFVFHAMNQGAYPHAFEIEGNGKEWKSEPIPPGGTAELRPTLTLGTYEVYCPIVDSHGNHQEKGMRTTFSVR